ncbi:MAG: hypothetical protein AAF624_01355 [Bacteroidota bacterium]
MLRATLLPAFTLLLAALVLAGCDSAVDAPEVAPAPDAFARGFTVEEAPDWTALFQRTSGWTGADGIFSIPLSGNDDYGTADGQNTLFLFSDTFIGDVNPDGSRSNARLVNNTIAQLRGGDPDPSAIQFYWPGGRSNPAAVFTPQIPGASPDDWYWLGDGFAAQDGTVYTLPLRVRRVADGPFGFDVVGVSLISLPPRSRPPFPTQRQAALPFFREPEGDRGQILMNAGVFVNTAWAGAPEPDGFVYVYGVEEVPFNKYLLVARVPDGAFEDFSQWRFYDGQTWTADFGRIARLTDRVSNELSVTPIPSGGYAVVFQKDTIGGEVAARTTPSLVGPFGTVIDVYRVPEADDARAFTYNAKAHPHLSDPGTLLISYNVNATDLFQGLGDESLYRPRFIRVRF